MKKVVIDSTDINCLPMCSLCTKHPSEILPARFKCCAKCKTRTYCNKICQTIDWKLGKHKGCCRSENHQNPSHQKWCAYLDRNPEIDESCAVQTRQIKSHPREVMTTGMNTCMFVVVKTTTEVIGWHASVQSNESCVRNKLKSVSKENFISGFIVPGEDREPVTMDLKFSCRTMQTCPWKDPTESRRIVLGILRDFQFYENLEVMPPVKSYKDFVVFDMCHKRPYSFSDVSQFDQGCTYDGAVDAPRGRINVSMGRDENEATLMMGVN
eukprot:GHVN01039976.1.p1 GENE.GHVN01039976.1~~GHVN01039976.1.p1  ORF type:complete len:268 (-),score=25.54 GHVN01039976.1:73-876(-)